MRQNMIDSEQLKGNIPGHVKGEHDSMCSHLAKWDQALKILNPKL